MTGGEVAKDAPWWRSFLRPLLVVPLATAAAAVITLSLVIWQQDPATTADRAQQGAVDAILRSADRRTVGLEAQNGTTARFVYSASVGKGVLLVHRLAPIEADQAYAVALLTPTGPLPASAFRPDANGDAVHLVPLEAAQAVGVEVTLGGAVVMRGRLTAGP
ncbi:MAG: anti-sigma factor [Ardenticatenales bacterium]